MATFLLVHGAWQGAWCWRDVVPRLRSRGHVAIARDLPGHGDDTMDRHAVTMRAYVDALVDAVGASSDRPIIVGHSMGGLAQQVAEAVPERIAAIIYVSALVAANGASMLDVVDGFDPDYLAQILWAADRRTGTIHPDGARAYLYPLCPKDRVEEAVARLTPEPVAPLQTPLFTTERAASVPAWYVGCSRDRVLSRDMQRTMQARAQVVRTFELDSDHSPFFSAPDDLVAALDEIARAVGT